jgi:hypothetical protein
VANQITQLTIQVEAGPEGDREEQAELGQSLRKDLLDLNLDTVDPVRTSAIPAGAKGDSVAIGTLVVTLAPIFLTELMKALQSWLSRHERASVAIETGSQKIVITGNPSIEQQRLIEFFVSRHKA